ncbi:uncharacterized protein LOC143356614 [Halictus rubicundus]|uniref:uncharacterized protein LOC143356614 n=1 Tax=Halictus rubicundus TaxID=77578 RepID=UPI004035E6C1
MRCPQFSVRCWSECLETIKQNASEALVRFVFQLCRLSMDKGQLSKDSPWKTKGCLFKDYIIFGNKKTLHRSLLLPIPRKRVLSLRSRSSCSLVLHITASNCMPMSLCVIYEPS